MGLPSACRRDLLFQRVLAGGRTAASDERTSFLRIQALDGGVTMEPAAIQRITKGCPMLLGLLAQHLGRGETFNDAVSDQVRREPLGRMLDPTRPEQSRSGPAACGKPLAWRVVQKKSNGDPEEKKTPFADKSAVRSAGNHYRC